MTRIYVPSNTSLLAATLASDLIVHDEARGIHFQYNFPPLVFFVVVELSV